MNYEKHDECSINIPLYYCDQKIIQDSSINQLYNAVNELNKRLENYKYDYYILLMMISLLIILFMVHIISNIYY